MRCPKCSYIGFEEADRCRNCGYEFALSDVQPASADLSMRIGEDDGGPLVDLALGQRAGGQPERPPTPLTVKPRLNLDRMIGVESPTPDLPLFDEAADLGQDLPPLVSAPASPRRPLAVRRHTPLPAPVRRPPPDLRSAAGSTLDLPLPRYASPDRVSRAGALEPDGMALAGSVRRVMAALLDTLLLGGVHWVTIYFTLRLCGLTLAEWRVLSLVPLLVFFLLVDGAYLTAFTTAGGQTIGKMAFGLKVVRDDQEAISLDVAATRALGAIGSALCLGTGLLPAFLNDDRRALHDRLAGTHVVKLPT
jgi:uncharacterized RDD family membrane protein YckC